MELPRNTRTYNTNILKELILDILKIETSNLCLENIYRCIYPTADIKEINKKPMLTIAGLRARQKKLMKNIGGKNMAKKTENISIRVTSEEKKIIEEKAKEKGYGTTAAYMLASAEKHMTVNIDTSHLRELVIYTKGIANQIESIIENVKARGYTTSEDLINLEKKLNQLKNIFMNCKMKLSTL